MSEVSDVKQTRGASGEFGGGTWTTSPNTRRNYQSRSASISQLAPGTDTEARAVFAFRRSLPMAAYLRSPRCLESGPLLGERGYSFGQLRLTRHRRLVLSGHVGTSLAACGCGNP
jgi:hypothetical protein